MDTLHEDLSTFMIAWRWILLRMKTGSDESCRENQINIMLNNFFPKNIPYIRSCNKNIVQADRPQKMTV